MEVSGVGRMNLRSMTRMGADVGFSDTKNCRGVAGKSRKNCEFYRESAEFPVNVLEEDAKGGVG